MAGSVELWDSVRQKIISDYDAHSQSVNKIRLSGDGKLIATAGVDKFFPETRSIKIWNLKAQQLQAIDTYTTTIENLKFSDDIKEVIAIVTDGKIFRTRRINYKCL